MKFFETKHERNSAKITSLILLIIALLLFVVGAPYKEIPEEYGVAINFGDSGPMSNQPIDAPVQSQNDAVLDEEIPEETGEEEITPDEVVDELSEETEPEKTTEDAQAKLEAEQEAAKAEEAKAAEEEAAKAEEAKAAEQAKIEADQKASEELLAQEEAEALEIKKAKEKAEAERIEADKIEKERLENERIKAEKVKADKLAKEKVEAEKKVQAAKEAKDKAVKAAKIKAAEDARIAKEKADKAAKAKAEREAKARADKVAKAKADRDAKASAAKAEADRATAAKAAAAKADADRKTAAAAKANGTSGGNKGNGFVLSQEGVVYPGCEGLYNAKRKQCMNQKINSFFSANFNDEVASDLNLDSEQSIRIWFKVSKTGQIIDVRTRADHPKLEEETKRVLSKLPRIKAAMQQGKPTVAPYALVIRIKMK